MAININNLQNNPQVKNDKVTLSEIRTQAYLQTREYYLSLFSNSPELKEVREAFAIHENVLPSSLHREKMLTFFLVEDQPHLAFGAILILLMNSKYKRTLRRSTQL